MLNNLALSIESGWIGISRDTGGDNLKMTITAIEEDEYGNKQYNSRI
ncbi:hypothetical protein [Caldifermentibacillus hisashii]